MKVMFFKDFENVCPKNLKEIVFCGKYVEATKKKSLDKPKKIG